MRVIVAGLGVQGHKRQAVAGSDCVATVDIVSSDADFKSVEDVPLGQYDAALVCTPDNAKPEILKYLLSNGKNVLVEKPLLAGENDTLQTLKSLAEEKGITCYTAYNHRFEPHFMRMKDAINSGNLGQIYRARLFYGNGTARLVRESAWRDQGAGVLPDLGSHLLDTFLFWFGRPDKPFEMISANRFENRAPDHCVFASNGTISLEAEMTLLSWRNHFSADIFAEEGSAHISSLCKWGPSSFTLRDRKLPSGRPDEHTVTISEADPTWKAEYQHFKSLVDAGTSNIENDIWIQDVLASLSRKIIMGTSQ